MYNEWVQKNYIDTSFTRDHWIIIDVMKYDTL